MMYSSQDMAKAQAQAQVAQATLAGSVNARNGRTVLDTLANILEQVSKLSAMSNDMADRVTGPQPTVNEASDALASDCMACVMSALFAIERKLHGVESGVARALQAL